MTSHDSVQLQTISQSREPQPHGNICRLVVLAFCCRQQIPTPHHFQKVRCDISGTAWPKSPLRDVNHPPPQNPGQTRRKNNRTNRQRETRKASPTGNYPPRLFGDRHTAAGRPHFAWSQSNHPRLERPWSFDFPPDEPAVKQLVAVPAEEEQTLAEPPLDGSSP